MLEEAQRKSPTVSHRIFSAVVGNPFKSILASEPIDYANACLPQRNVVTTVSFTKTEDNQQERKQERGKGGNVRSVAPFPGSRS